MTRQKSNLFLGSFGILAAAASIDALEMVGGNLCNTNDFAVLVQEIVESRDATIFEGQSEISSGEEKFMVGTTKNGIRRGLLAFNFKEDDFPPDAKVECTEIRLHVVQNGGSSAQVPEITLHRITKGWKTSGSNRLTGVNGGKAANGDVTWQYSKYPNSFWKEEGGDFDDTVVARKTEIALMHSFGNTLLMARLVQEWIEVGDKSVSAPFNAGFMLVGEENLSSEKFVHYNGIENAPGLIPRLIVTYTSPSQGKDHRDYTCYVSTDTSPSQGKDQRDCTGSVSNDTPPSQEEDHRDYTGSVSEAGPGPSSAYSDNNVVSDVLFFLGGVVFAGLVIFFMNYWRKKLQGKEKESEPGPTTTETDLELTEQAVAA